jgi:CheY-like chemotaxis protein/DNA-binding HxlR family transcriptional regulator
MKILLVEDDRILKHGLKELLAEEGHEIQEATDGLEALSLISGSTPDVILTDLKMPKLDGIGLLKKVKSIHPQIPVVIMTAFATVDTAITALKLGAYDYLKKPIDIQDVVSLLESINEETELGSFFELNYLGRNDDCLEVYKELTQPRPGLIITSTPHQLEKLDLRGDVIAIKSAHEVRSVIENYPSNEMGLVIFLHNIESLFPPSLDLRNYFQSLFDLIISRRAYVIIGIESRGFSEELWDEFIHQSADYYVKLFSETLRNHLRREIIKFLYNNNKQKFSGIQRGIDLQDSPKLSFHLKKLVADGVLTRTSHGDYLITDKGITLARTIEFLTTEAETAWIGLV